jgi:hypothetical protein
MYLRSRIRGGAGRVVGIPPQVDAIGRLIEGPGGSIACRNCKQTPNPENPNPGQYCRPPHRVPILARAIACQSMAAPNFKGVPASGIGYLSPLAQLKTTARSSGRTRPSARAAL